LSAIHDAENTFSFPKPLALASDFSLSSGIPEEVISHSGLKASEAFVTGFPVMFRDLWRLGIRGMTRRDRSTTNDIGSRYSRSN
jgi:hypothetical protein